MKFYQHWLGDYQGATKRLSMLEHGAYRLLLDEYYSTEGPLPANAMQLHRVCMAFADDEQKAVHTVLHQFFRLTENGWVNDRAEKEIAKALEVSEKRRGAALKRHGKDAKAHASAHASAHANVGANDVQNVCYPQPQPQDIKKTKEGGRFTPPALEEVRAYCQERGNSVNPDKWMAYYESNGWRVGKNPMKNWKAAVITWEDPGPKPAFPSQGQSLDDDDAKARRMIELTNRRISHA